MSICCEHITTLLEMSGFNFTPQASVLSFLELWFSCHASDVPFQYLPIIFFWSLWILRNQCIFEDRKPVASLLISRIDSLYALYPVPPPKTRLRMIGTRPVHVFPVAYFDGAAQNNMGGAGFVIYISETHYLCFSVGCGLSSNTRAELLALWSVLRVCMLMGLPVHMIFGDSMVVISWVKKLSTLNIPSLKHWCDDIFSMMLLAPPVSFNHIYRELNMLADDLSKKALKMNLGLGYFSEYLDGLVIGEGTFSLF